MSSPLTATSALRTSSATIRRGSTYPNVANAHDVGGVRAEPVLGLIEVLFDLRPLKVANEEQRVDVEADHGDAERHDDGEGGHVIEEPADGQPLGRPAGLGPEEPRRDELGEHQPQREKRRQHRPPRQKDHPVLARQLQHLLGQRRGVARTNRPISLYCRNRRYVPTKKSSMK